MSSVCPAAFFIRAHPTGTYTPVRIGSNNSIARYTESGYGNAVK